MNKAVYLFMLKNYGRQPGTWAGVFGEIVRTLAIRVFTIIIMSDAINNLVHHDFEAAKANVITYLVVFLGGSLIGSACDLIAFRSENYHYRKLMARYHEKLTSKDMSFYRDHQTGYLAGLFRQHMDSGMRLVWLMRGEMIRVIISMSVPTIILLVANWKIGLVAIGIVILQLIYIVWSSSKSNKHRQRSHEIYRKITGEVADEVTNIIAFKSSGHEKEAQGRIAELGQEEGETFWLRRKVATLLDLPRNVITGFAMALAFYLVIIHAIDNPDGIGLVAVTLMYMFQIVRNVNELPHLIVQHDDLITKLYPTLEYLTAKHEEIKDPAKPKKLTISKGSIALQDISFSYPPHDENGTRIPVFEHLDIRIKGGEQIGIVGLSGAGKSTLTSLLMRFDDIDSGAITMDDTDIRNVRQSDLRRNIAYVPQEPLLFHRTIRENIMYFDESASEGDVIKAAKAAHAHEFITKLPKGYDTMVGERGVKLSGGQKQRVVIARVVLKNAPIMIFDEATSALDSESEQIIQRALPKIIGKHTAIVIAHRLSTVAGLDRIIVMHNGKIIEEGSHEQLLTLKGQYYSLWQKQVANS